MLLGCLWCRLELRIVGPIARDPPDHSYWLPTDPHPDPHILFAPMLILLAVIVAWAPFSREWPGRVTCHAALHGRLERCRPAADDCPRTPATGSNSNTRRSAALPR
jgi:hypothetical protein